MNEKTDAVTLTDRYIVGVIRTVPHTQRDHVATELGALVHDQVDARVEAGEDPVEAERAVLQELGDPDALAAGYADRPLYLIGPRYFLTWWRLLKLLLWIMIPIATIGVVIGLTISGAEFGEIVGTTAAVFFGTIVHMAFWTTLVFALIERSAGDAAAPAAWKLDDLPEPAETGAGRGDLIGALVVLAVSAGLVLWDHLFGAAYLESAGGWVQALHPGLWPVGIVVLFVFIAMEAVLAVAVYATRRWTFGLAVLNAGLNVVFVVVAIWLLVSGNLLNPAFWPAIIPDAEAAVTVDGIIKALVGVGIVATCVWDTIDAFLKARRARLGHRRAR